ncbi:unnamed protein product, partial [Didymodactylos carnosus]
YFIVHLCKNLTLIYDEYYQTYQENFDSLMFYGGFELSDEGIKELKQSIAHLHFNIAEVYAFKHCQQILEIFSEFYPKYPVGIADICDVLGEIYYKMTKYELSLEYLHSEPRFDYINRILPKKDVSNLQYLPNALRKDG